MRRFDALCLDPFAAYTSERIRALRERCRLSCRSNRTVLALVSSSSLSTVRDLERGAEHPSGLSLTLSRLLNRVGLGAQP
jgi:putative transcriptional regulator